MQLPYHQKLGQTNVQVANIRLDASAQPRVEIDQPLALEYGEAMRNNGIGSFPPVTIFYDGKDLWLADGFHRVIGAKAYHIVMIRADVQEGTLRDAILFSVGANARHGKRRSNEDRRRAVMTLLQDEEWKKWSNSEIGRRCGVNHHIVADLRVSLGDSPSENERRTYTTKHGTVTTMDTSRIGRPADNLVTRQAAKNGALVADKYYPVHHGDKIIVNDPFDSEATAQADERYGEGFVFQSGKLVAECILSGTNYATYAIVAPVQPQAIETRTTPNAGPAAQPRQAQHPAPAKQSEPSRQAARPMGSQPLSLAGGVRPMGSALPSVPSVEATPSALPATPVDQEPEKRQWQDKPAASARPEPRFSFRQDQAGRVAATATTAAPSRVEGSTVIPSTSDEPLEAFAGAFTDPDLDGDLGGEASGSSPDGDAALQEACERLKAVSPGAARRVALIADKYSDEAALDAAAACLAVVEDTEYVRQDLDAARQQIEELQRHSGGYRH